MSTNPIKDALAALSRNAEHVEAAALGGTLAHDALPRQALAALQQAIALRAAGDDAWRLHPRLREYLQDILQNFGAYPSPTGIGEKITTLRALRDEALQAFADRDHESVAALLQQIAVTVWDIADQTERNLKFLGSMMSIKYGAVQTLRAKLGQNRWYQRQAGILGQDLARLLKVAQDVEQDADTRGWEVARLVRRTVLDRLHLWQVRLSGVSDQLLHEMYRLREVEVNLKNLARVDTFLTQNPAWPGLDMEIPAQYPVALEHAALPKLRPHADPLDDDRTVRHELEQLARSLPAATQLRRRDVIAPLTPRTDVGEPPQPDPYLLALRSFGLAAARAQHPLSVLGWASTAPEASVLRPPAATAVRPSVWLMFTICALDGRSHSLGGRPVRFAVDPVRNLPAPGERLPHTFRDALVRVAG